MNWRGFTILTCLLSPTFAGAAEITSNGTGGGLWSSPSTWLGGKQPGPDDDVVLRKYDIVTFDRNDADKVTCKKLQIDPKGVLQFKTNGGKLLCVVEGGIENFGIIKMDGTRSAQDDFELRLAGKSTLFGPHLKLAKGAALLLYGKAFKDAKKNVAIESALYDEKKLPLAAIVDIDGQVAIDWQKARLKDVKLNVKSLDNTGAKPNERMQVLDCRFEGLSRINCTYCDTPIIGRNTFDYAGEAVIAEPALQVWYCPLAEVKGNSIKGRYFRGISFVAGTDVSIVGNTVEGCETGMQSGTGPPNAMLKKNVIKSCDIGLKMESATGVVEDLVITDAHQAFICENSALQLTNVSISRRGFFRGRTMGFQHLGGKVSLLNCNFTPDDVVMTLPATAKDEPLECQQYVLVGVKDAPEGAVVDVRTVTPPVAKDVMDPNVRNTPAALVKGLTPGPRTLNPLIVKTWSMDLKAKVNPAPQYQVLLLGAPAKEGDPRPVLKMVPFAPVLDAVRANLEDDTPTLEVSAK